MKEIVMNDKDREGNDKNLKVKLVGPAVEFSSSENRVRCPPPRLGEHTSQVLMELLNYSKEQIDELVQNRDVQ